MKKSLCLLHHSLEWETRTNTYKGDTLNLLKHVVEGYEQNGYPLRGSIISVDQYYISIPLAKWLYSKHITCIGTIETNWNRLPKEIKEIKAKEKNSWTECNEEGANVHLYSYFFKTKLTEMRNVLLLHTTEAAHYVTNDEKKHKKTHIRLYYRCYRHTWSMNGFPYLLAKSKKWKLFALAYVLDISRVNNQEIYAMNIRDARTKSFESG